MRSRLTALRRLRRGALLVTAGLLVAGGATAYAASGDGAPAYRTVVASRGDVDEVLSVSGTITPSDSADLAFAGSGTVTRVAVSVGSTVTAGEVVARLDQSDARAALVSARATLAAARARLESDETAQADAVTSASTSTTTSSPTATASSKPTTATSAQPSAKPTTATSAQPTAKPSPSTTTSSTALQQSLDTLRKQQEAVTSASTTSTTALAAARAALSAQTDACESAFDDGAQDTTSSSGSGPTADPSADPSATPPTAAPSAPASDPADERCTASLAAVQEAQTDVATAQDALAAALAQLGGTLQTAITTLGSSSSSTSTPSTGSTPTKQPTGSTSQAAKPTTGPLTPTSGTNGETSPSTAPTGSNQTQGGTTTGNTGGTGSMDVTAATLADDQAQIDQAKATLVGAQDALDATVLRAPRAGTVVQLDLDKGESVTSGSTVASLVSPGATTVVSQLTEAQSRSLEIGMVAEVTPSGAEDAVTGKVSEISRTATTSTTGTTTYPVTITLDATDLHLGTGAPASVALVVATSTDVVTVPASAVRSGRVETWNGSTLQTVRVITGVVGSSAVEITDGLTAGTTVVLADLDQALPSADDSTTGQGGQGGQGGFGGTGGPGGGFGGAPGGGGPPGGAGQPG